MVEMRSYDNGDYTWDIGKLATTGSFATQTLPGRGQVVLCERGREQEGPG